MPGMFAPNGSCHDSHSFFIKIVTWLHPLRDVVIGGRGIPPSGFYLPDFLTAGNMIARACIHIKTGAAWR
jgi:hypothetical protein